VRLVVTPTELIDMKTACICLAAAALLLSSCTKPEVTPPAAAEPEALARTEFTKRVENYFEYEPLRGGKPSQVRIHLTDLSDGSPVEKAEVTLFVRSKGSTNPVVQTTSRIGKVTGIYVAELNVPKAGEYDIEFHIKNDKLDERLPLTNFKVE
jgi:5-hydroxyisourate hydrolase-like protein (transthyretin family)